MALSASSIRELYYDAETVFSTDPDATGAGSLRIPAESVVHSLSREHLRLATAQDRLTSSPSVAGVQGGTLTFQTPVVGAATNAGGAVAPEPWFDALMLACSHVGHDGTGSAADAVQSLKDHGWGFAPPDKKSGKPKKKP